jgi:hypothetical protein
MKKRDSIKTNRDEELLSSAAAPAYFAAPVCRDRNCT